MYYNLKMHKFKYEALYRMLVIVERYISKVKEWLQNAIRRCSNCGKPLEDSDFL